MAQEPTGKPGEPDPSMDDILASIRRILSDEEKAAKAAKPPGEGVLMLDASMMVDEPTSHAEDHVTDSDPDPAAASMGGLPPEPYFPPLPSREVPPPPVNESLDGLVAPEAAAAAAGSVGALMRTLVAERNAVVHRGGPSIEDLVREEIRPLLKAWLDAHLPALVERQVRAEIERVVGRITG